MSRYHSHHLYLKKRGKTKHPKGKREALPSCSNASSDGCPMNCWGGRQAGTIQDAFECVYNGGHKKYCPYVREYYKTHVDEKHYNGHDPNMKLRRY